MSRPNYAPKEKYTGDGGNDTYSFDFKIESLTHLLVVAYDDEGEETARVRGTDTSFLSSVSFDIHDGGGSVVLQSNLPVDHELFLIQANDEPTQDYSFRNKDSFRLPRFEWALDLLAGAIQRLRFLASQSLRISDRDDEGTVNTMLPSMEGNAGKCIVVSDDETSFDIVPRVTGEELSSAIDDVLLPPGGGEGAVLSKASTGDQAVQWEEMEFSGYSNLKGETISYTGLTQTLSNILDFQYTPPAVSLAVTGSGSVREKGDEVTAATMTATITKRSNDIAAVRYYVAGSLYATEAAPNPEGGTESEAWTGSIDDTTVFSVQVDDVGGDGGPSTITSSRTFNYVYPYYYGVGSSGLTATQVAALTKDIRTENSNYNRTFGATSGEVYYFAYPASYGTLSSILDENNFETLGDWTLRVEDITGLDGNAVSYNIYEFDNVVTAPATNYIFAQ